MNGHGRWLFFFFFFLILFCYYYYFFSIFIYASFALYLTSQLTDIFCYKKCHSFYVCFNVDFCHLLFRFVMFQLKFSVLDHSLDTILPLGISTTNKILLFNISFLWCISKELIIMIMRTNPLIMFLFGLCIQISYQVQFPAIQIRGYLV